MGLTTNKLTRVSSAGGQHKYFYATNDTKAAVETAGYFDDLVDLLNIGDGIEVVGDIDGTPFLSQYIVSDNDGSAVTLTEHSSVTQNVLQVVTVRVTALGTASNHYVPSPCAGSISAVYGVSNAANGTLASTIDILVDAAAKATLSFSDSYVAGTSVTDASITANTLSAGEIIHIDNNGEGDGTGEAVITIVITPT